MGTEASNEAQRFRYSTWPGEPVDLPRLYTWAGTELTDGWVGERNYLMEDGGELGLGPSFRLPQEVEAPADLHVFEFADVDARDLDQILALARKVGLPAPTWGQDPWADVRGPAGSDIEAIRYQETVSDVASELGVAAPDVLSPDRKGMWHHAELALRVELVRKFVQTLQAHSDRDPLADIWGTDSEPDPFDPEGMVWPKDAEHRAGGVFMRRLNAAVARFNVRVASRDWPDETRWSPYEVASLAVFNDLTSGAHYGICGNETCRRVFTRQRGRAAAGQYRSVGVKYCMPSCARAQSQRDRRREAKQTKEQG